MTRLARRFKAALLGTATILYATGAAVWVLGLDVFKTDHGFGLEASPLRPLALHAHAVAGLLFLILFGYLWRAHVEPGLARRRRSRGGLLMVVLFALMFVTTPLIFYLVDEKSRAWAAAVHTWAGLSVLAPFLVHRHAES